MVRSKHHLDPVHYHEVGIELIEDHPDQPRKTVDENGLRALAENIKEYGLLHPITVIVRPDNDNRYILCAGQRRLSALKLLGKTQVPIIVAQKGDPDEIAMIENTQREDVHPLEQAEAAARLIEKHGYTHEKLADNVIHKSRSTITELLSLNELPGDIKAECRTSDIHKSQLLAVARLGDDPAAQRQLWDEIKAGKVSARSALGRQRGRGTKDAADTPKELKPIIRVIATGQHMLETLQKIKKRPVEPTTLAAQKESIDVLKELHKKIGRVINSLQNLEVPQSPDKKTGREEITQEAADTAV